MTNNHENLEAFLGEEAGYFPAASTDDRPSASIVDAWYTGPIAAMMSRFGVTDSIIEDSLADDFYLYWLWRHASPAGADERSDESETNRWVGRPYVPSPRTLRLIEMEIGRISFS